MRLTTAKFSLRRNRKLCLARPQGSASTSASEGGLRLAHPKAPPQPRSRKVVSASPNPRAWPQPRPRKVVSASPDLRARPREKSPPRPTFGSDRPRHGGYIIALLLASSGYGEQDRRPIWLPPVTSNDGSPRASMTTAVLSPLRKQGNVSKIPATSTAVLLQGSGAPPTATLSPTQGSSTSPTATLACTQGSSTSQLDTLAPSYTPHCTPGPSPCIYKRRSRAFMREGRAGERADEQAHSLSLANACNPYYERIPPAQDNTSRVSPPCVPSRANPSGLGHAATNLLVGPGTPWGRNADSWRAR
jgi:hypothetical protein